MTSSQSSQFKKLVATLAVAASMIVPASAGAHNSHAATPVAHQATTCSDYSNQADAQRNADTRDTDSDGVYCESLPCPCAGPGSTSRPKAPVVRRPKHHPKPKRKPSLFAGRCQRGRLPDTSCSPGGVMTTDTKAVCTPGYSKSVRNVSESLKNKVYYAYGIRRHPRGVYEMDHIIPLELGGSNARANLFPEAAGPKPGFHEKDRVENALHAAVCRGEIGLTDAQRIISTNWVTAFNTLFA